jgi:hypothetical protein
MNFYVDLAVAVILRLVKDRRGAHQYFPALAKVFLVLRDFSLSDPAFAAEINRRAGNV